MKIVEYREEYFEAFKKISYEWLLANNLLEKEDEVLLQNPSSFIKRGGRIYMLCFQESCVGTVSVEQVEPGCFEILKLGVLEKYRGRGFGKLLIAHALASAKSQGAKCVILHSNSKLQTAIELYESLGFQKISFTQGRYLTSDVKMELKFI